MNSQTIMKTKPEVRPTFTRIIGGVLQRACACGQHKARSDGECEECQKKRQGTLQRAAVNHAPTTLVPSIVHEVLRSPGQPLNAATHAFMEPRFGHDFSRVRSSSGVSKTKAYPSDRKGSDVVAREVADISDLEEGDEDERLMPSDETEEARPRSERAGSLAETQSDEAANLSSTKEKIEFEVLPAGLPPLSAAAGKTKCPAPGNAPINFGTHKSTAAQIAGMAACDWGITSPDPLQVTTKTCRDGANWHLRVTKVKSIIRTFSRQLPGQHEPTVGNSTAANFCPQVTELDTLGSCAGSWYMIAAVRAHERVHVDEWRTSMGGDWLTQKGIIEGLSVPASGATKSKAAATTAMRTSAAFVNALQTDSATGNYPAFWGIADPNIQTDAAERVIVTPRIRQLCVHARNRGWGPAGCPVCANLGIT